MKYYISENNQAVGPFTIDELRHRSVTPDTLVWYEGLNDWVRADTIEIIRRELLSSYPRTDEPKRQYTDYRGPQPQSCPSTYLIPAILLTICCCNPVAIVAIVFALQVQPAYARGHYEQARDASDTARRWCIIAAIAWVIIFGLFNIINWPPIWPAPYMSSFFTFF